MALTSPIGTRECRNTMDRCGHPCGSDQSTLGILAPGIMSRLLALVRRLPEVHVGKWRDAVNALQCAKATQAQIQFDGNSVCFSQPTGRSKSPESTAFGSAYVVRGTALSGTRSNESVGKRAREVVYTCRGIIRGNTFSRQRRPALFREVRFLRFITLAFSTTHDQ